MNITIKNIKQVVVKQVVCAAFFILVLFVVVLKTNAAPLDGFEQTLVQPNGTEVNCLMYGDEVYSYMCDTEGNVIVENPETGYYVYAALVDGQIVPTEYACGIDTPGSGGGGTADLLQSDEIPESVVNGAYQNSRFYQASQPEQQVTPFSLTAERDDFNGFEINNIVVFIRFNDTNYTNTSSSFYNGLFNTNSDSAKNYYNEISYSKVKLNSIFYPQTTSSTILTYRDTYNASYYKASNYNYDWEQQKEREQAMFERAINYVKSQIPADLDLDRNNDGEVDMITFVLPGLIIPGSNQVCWPHQWSFDYDSGITINGSEVYNYDVQIEGALRGQKASDGTYTFQTASAIICHETLHILGFPDLYYYNWSYPTNKVSMGKWDIMCESNGAHPSAYIKYEYGKWIDLPEIKSAGTYTLNPLINSTNNSYMIRSPRSKDEFFVVEYRKSTGNFEDAIPSTSLVVYRVLVNNMGMGNAYASTSTGTDDEVRQIVNKTSGSTTLYFSNGSSSGITISGISATGSTATFSVSFPSDKNLFYFKDKNLAAAICTALGKSEGQVTTADLAAMQSLTLSKGYYQLPFDLSGLENLTNLKTLTANDCEIDDISALASLTNLESLQLQNCNITDISPLSGLIKLKTLKLRGNLIQDYSPVQSYYSGITTKDFSLSNKDDVILWLPNVTSDGKVGTVYAKLSVTKPTYIYCSFEKYDSNGILLKRYRTSAYTYGAQISVTAPDYIFNDDNNSYVVLKAYERNDYRQLIAESVIRKNSFNLSSFN